MASPIQLKNNAVGRLTSGVSAAATTLTLVSGDGAKFPTLTGAQYFPATLIRASDSAVEIVKVTARSGDVLTVVRAQEGTSGLVLLAGDRIELRMTAQTLLDQVTYTISSFGVGNTDTVAWTSPDDWTKATGTYIVTAANFPTHPFPGDSTDCVVMHSRSTSTANQIAFIADSGVSVVRVATRRWGGGSGGSWSTWREVYHTGNLGVASETAAGIVELATAGEAQALASATLALTPARLADAFKGANQSLGENGYQKLPSGLIIQWGSGLAGIGGSAISFPLAFPTACRMVNASGGNDNNVSVNAYGQTLSGFTAKANTTTGGPYGFQWVAIGH